MILLASEAKTLQVHLPHGSMLQLQPAEESRIIPIGDLCVCVCVCVCVLGPGTLGRLIGITALPAVPTTTRALVPLLSLLVVFPPQSGSILSNFWVCCAVQGCGTSGPVIPFSTPTPCTPDSRHRLGHGIRGVWGRCSHSRTNTCYTCTVLCCLSKSCCCGLVAQSCTTLCNPMDCTTPDFSILHYLL